NRSVVGPGQACVKGLETAVPASIYAASAARFRRRPQRQAGNTMSIVRYSRHGHRPTLLRGDSLQSELRQAFDRLFDAPFFPQDADDSAVVTAQWQPRVDVKEEPTRFVIYADLPGMDPQDIEVSM